jgi:predicted kinase
MMNPTTKYRSSNLFMVVIHGPMGSGKTALADLLHDEIADTAHFGVDHVKWLVSDFKNVPSHTQIAKNMIPTMAEGYLKQGISLILEQAFSRDEIRSLEQIAVQYGAQFHVYRLDADKTILNERIVERTKRLGKPEVTTEHINRSYDEYKEKMYEGGTLFDSSKNSIREMADIIIKDLGLI